MARTDRTDRPEARAGVADVDLGSRTAVVTGSTAGIGRALAHALGRLGADVLVQGRDRDAGRAVVADLRALGVDATFQAADFTDAAAVRGLATAAREWADGIDLLVHNAGALFREGRLTGLGVERTFQVNHLAPYLLTAELLDALTADARVVTTASEGHRGVALGLDSVTDLEGYSGSRAYRRSKLANVAFAAELAHRLEVAGRSVTSNALHPGAVPGTGFSRFLPDPLPGIVRRLDALPFLASVTEAAATPLFLAASPRVAGVSGRYFVDCRPRTPAAPARDPDTRRRLWTRSASLLGIEPPLADGA
ncbi:MAG: SDR family NAD(P)-dependent oxidoreductase [Haloarculaceae archaeon]